MGATLRGLGGFQEALAVLCTEALGQHKAARWGAELEHGTWSHRLEARATCQAPHQAPSPLRPAPSGI